MINEAARLSALNPADPYRWAMIIGIGLSVLFWWRLSKRDSRLFIIYITALLSAFLGGKIVYILSEGWLYWNSPWRWIILATGKTIIGALLGGYLGVEFAKNALGYTKPTGDWFASLAPAGVALGRVGCLLHGCCLGARCEPAWYAMRDSHGIPRWPAVPVEFGFNLLACAVFWIMRRKKILPGQHFHLYLISYGLFRFIHEFWRDTPQILAGLSGYQITALIVVVLGAVRFAQRAKVSLVELSIDCS